MFECLIYFLVEKGVISYLIKQMVEDEGSSKMFTGRGRSHASCLHTHLHYYTPLKTQDLGKTKYSKVFSSVFFN